MRTARWPARQQHEGLRAQFLCRNVMRPLLRSYGEMSQVTRSPTWAGEEDSLRPKCVSSPGAVVASNPSTYLGKMRARVRGGEGWAAFGEWDWAPG